MVKLRNVSEKIFCEVTRSTGELSQTPLLGRDKMRKRICNTNLQRHDKEGEIEMGTDGVWNRSRRVAETRTPDLYLNFHSMSIAGYAIDPMIRPE